MTNDWCYSEVSWGQSVRERERERWRQRERERERERERDEGRDRWKWIFFLLVRLHHAAYSDHDNTIDRHVYHSCTCSIHFFLFVFPISRSKLHSPITEYNISLSLSLCLHHSLSFSHSLIHPSGCTLSSMYEASPQLLAHCRNNLTWVLKCEVVEHIVQHDGMFLLVTGAYIKHLKNRLRGDFNVKK